MTDQDALSELLERLGERTSVGPPPVAVMLARARRARRRRTVMASTAAMVAVVASVGGVWVLSSLFSQGGDRAQIASGSPSPAVSTSAAPTSETSLEGDWIVRALVGTDGQSVLPASARDRVKLTFAHGAMTGTTGCNSVFGSYEQGGAQGQDLRFPGERLGSTLVACEEPPLIPRLLDVRHVSGSAGVRYLQAENWIVIAELRRTS